MRAGRLRNEGALQSPVLTRDTHGESIRVWETVGLFSFEKKVLGGDEVVIAGQLTSEVKHRVTARFRDDFSADKRILHGSAALDIETVLDMDERTARQMFGSELLQIVAVLEVEDRDHETQLICEETV